MVGRGGGAPYLGSRDIRNSCLQMVCKFAKSKVPLSGAIIQENASQYVKELSIENFKAPEGWLRRWKERNNVPICSKQNIPTQVREVLKGKFEQSSYNWHGISECCW